MDHPDAPAEKGRKYARAELERRFLLAAVPSVAPARRVRIEDRYLDGTRLRLRRALDLDTARVELKLGQKIPAPDGTPGLITNLYLSAAEYERLVALPAATLAKIRLSIPPFGVDVFEGQLEGLVLAETEFETEAACSAFAPPEGLAEVISEVTRDLELTGGRLATMTREELRATLARYNVTLAGPVE